MFMDLYAREGYTEDGIFDWTIAHASKSGKLTPSAAARLAKVSGAKHEPPTVRPKATAEAKKTLEDGIAKLVQKVDPVMKSHQERHATRARDEANGQLGPAKPGPAAKEKVVSKVKVVPEKTKPTTNDPEPKIRPKVLNKVAIATKPAPLLVKPKAKPLAVKVEPVKPPPRPVAKVPRAKPAPRPNLCKTEKIPVLDSLTPPTSSPQRDVDEVLVKMGDLKISEKQPSTQRDTKMSRPCHVHKSIRNVPAPKPTPPPLPVRPTAVKQPVQKEAASKFRLTKPLIAIKEPPSSESSFEVIESSSDLDVTKPIKPAAVPTKRIPLRMCNVNPRPVPALVPSSQQRRKNPPRLVNVNTNAKSPPRRRVIVTRATAGRKEG